MYVHLIWRLQKTTYTDTSIDRFEPEPAQLIETTGISTSAEGVFDIEDFRGGTPQEKRWSKNQDVFFSFFDFWRQRL